MGLAGGREWGKKRRRSEGSEWKLGKEGAGEGGREGGRARTRVAMAEDTPCVVSEVNFLQARSILHIQAFYAVGEA
jgi:hypothetical protein